MLIGLLLALLGGPGSGVEVDVVALAEIPGPFAWIQEAAVGGAGYGRRGVHCLHVLPFPPPDDRGSATVPLDEALVRFRDGVPPSVRAGALSRIGARVLRETRSGLLQAVRLPRGLGLEAAIKALEEESAVAFAEPRPISPFRPSGAGGGLPDDPLLPKQWAIQNAGETGCFKAGVDIDLPAAWEITSGRPDVIVVVIDSGVDLEHPDLRGQLYPQGDEDWNFSVPNSTAPVDASGHGTAVAGLAVAAAGNGEGIAGVAPGCRLMPLKIDGLDMVMNFIEALDYLVEFAGRHPDLRFVVNGSISVTDTRAVHDAVIRARAAGITMCFSAGNGGGVVDCPARYPESIAVGAMAPDGARKRGGGCGGGEWSSSHGAELDIVSPGILLATTDMTGPGGKTSGDYDLEFGGTSGASPIVAGVAALMLSANRNLTPDRIVEILKVAALDGGGDPAEDNPGFDEYMGWGRVQAGRAVSLAAADWKLELGNTDCDPDIDIADIRMILACLFSGSPATPCFSAADVNGDGRANLSDAVYLASWLFRGGPPPIGQARLAAAGE
jgi:subtilisin family serine protease